MKIPRPARLLAAPALLLPALAPRLLAQDQLPDLRSLVLIDRVLATVNDAVILNSEVATLTVGDVRGREAELGRPLTRDERGWLERQNLLQKIDQIALAQAAKTLGVLPPDRVEEILQRELTQDEEEQVRDLGTYQKYSQELTRQNRTYQTYEREQRVVKLADLTRQMTALRLQNQRNLFITPRRMRDYYRRHVDEFVHGNSSSVAMVACLGPERAAVAKEVIAAWQQENVPSADLANRFAARGVVRLPDLTRLAADSRVRADLLAFALAGPLGAVSAPVPVGEGAQQGLQVWKVVEFVPARNGRFEDPEVQSQIRTYLENQVWLELMKQTIERARARTEAWFPPPLGR